MERWFEAMKEQQRHRMAALGEIPAELVLKNAQVVNNDGEVIAGLYACGNCTASIAGGAYLGGGATLCPGATMAYRAAHHALDIA